MSWGPLEGVGTANSVTDPAVVIRPIWLAPSSVNHRLPSGPAAMPTGELNGVGTGNSLARLGEACAGTASAPTITRAAGMRLMDRVGRMASLLASVHGTRP